MCDMILRYDNYDLLGYQPYLANIFLINPGDFCFSPLSQQPHLFILKLRTLWVYVSLAFSPIGVLKVIGDRNTTAY